MTRESLLAEEQMPRMPEVLKQTASPFFVKKVLCGLLYESNAGVFLKD
jgi:hypothetical protein